MYPGSLYYRGFFMVNGESASGKGLVGVSFVVLSRVSTSGLRLASCSIAEALAQATEASRNEARARCPKSETGNR